jgi:ketosteroid isomerase-like protein
VYKLIVKRIVRRTFQRLSEGDYEAVVRQFGPDSRFLFSGDHALGGERRGQDAVRRWFQQMLGLFPGIRIEPQDVVVNGWPWNTTVATHLAISATLADGRPYRNEGMQLLRLRWGRVVEDLIFEDTLKLEVELRRMAPAEPVGATAP